MRPSQPAGRALSLFSSSFSSSFTFLFCSFASFFLKHIFCFFASLFARAFTTVRLPYPSVFGESCRMWQLGCPVTAVGTHPCHKKVETLGRQIYSRDHKKPSPLLPVHLYLTFPIPLCHVWPIYCKCLYTGMRILRSFFFRNASIDT